MVPHLLIIRAERVVGRAKVRPRVRHRVRGGHISHVFGHNDGEAAVEVEVDVAVEEPRAGVVGAEADRDVVPRRAGRDDIALRGVDVVVLGAAGRANNVEGVLCATSQ